MDYLTKGILDDVSTEDIFEYLETYRSVDFDGDPTEDIVNDYFHGDFDLKKLLKDIGKQNVLKYFIYRALLYPN